LFNHFSRTSKDNSDLSGQKCYASAEEWTTTNFNISKSLDCLSCNMGNTYGGKYSPGNKEFVEDFPK
jgi:hypothetical protein